MTTEQAECIRDLVRSFRVVVDKIDACSGSPKFSADDHERLALLAERAETLLGNT